LKITQQYNWMIFISKLKSTNFSIVNYKLDKKKHFLLYYQ